MQDKKPDAPVSENSNLVIVTTPEYVKDSIKEAIAEHAASRNHPYATQAEPGFVTLSNETDSDSEITVATSKAVKKAYDLANTANQNALNNNSNLYLEKKQNGADIPDKDAFIDNLGLQDTVSQAKNAVPNNRKINDKSLDRDVTLSADDVKALSLNGGTLDGNLRINGDEFSGIHINNKLTTTQAVNGIDFMFSGEVMASITSGLLQGGASFMKLLLSPQGSISDRREVAVDLNANLKRLFLQNGWVLDNYARMTDFEFNANDNGYLRFPGGFMIQWCYGSTDDSGWGTADFPGVWSQRCFGVIAINIAGNSPASSFAGVKRLDDRNFQVTQLETLDIPNRGKPFFAIGIGH
ncbi:tail fiber protein [Xenorhabdus indica]|uniref:tail fiber protein n=1 Tax=Xenorhabdus indica TaxID=333964 RepID=UPI001FE490E7|nr:phage tail protein [Xenorhabdus indica]MBC8947116.1 tail protein [Xenorhabdus indica]